MYPTSERYKNLIYNKQSLLKINIDGTEIDSKHILDFSVSHYLFSNDEFSLGATPAKAIELKIHKDSLPETYNNIYVETGVRLRNSVWSVKNVDDSKVKELNSNVPVYMLGKRYEIIPIGHFIIEDVSKEDDYTVTIKAIDKMVKFEFNYDGSKLSYPCSILTVLKDICSKAEVELRFYFFFEYE